jgi:hypothetical protein
LFIVLEPAIVDPFFSVHLLDIALNYVNTTHNVTVNETADTVAPNALSATVNYSTGLLTVTTSETIDVTPLSLITPSRFYLLNNQTVATSTNRIVQLSNTSPVGPHQSDGLTFQLLLTEVERVQSLEMSNTLGGDGSAIVLETMPGAFYDVGENENNHNTGLPVTEIPDTVRS